VIVLTRIPNGDSGKLGIAIAIAYAIALGAGLVNGLMVSRIGITPIVATLGMSASSTAESSRSRTERPRDTTERLYSFVNSSTLGVPTTVWIAIGVTAVVGFVVKRTVAGRRFEAVGASAAPARAAGLGIHPLHARRVRRRPASSTARPASCSLA
jgi:ribose transport system permease protein